MRSLSLRLRTFAAAILALIIFVPTTVLTLEKAFNFSLSQSMQQQLKVQSLTLISEFEFDKGLVQMPEQLINDQFNIPGSGLYAFIQTDQTIVWTSLSSLNQAQLPLLTPPAVGDESFIDDFIWGERFFLFAYTAEFDTGEGYQAVSFFILQDKHIFDAEKAHFASILWKWLGLVALIMLVLLLVSLNAALLPISRLNKQIMQAERGLIKRIEQQYPPELERLKSSINHLLNSEEQQRSRYKNSLSDLAHSLKTPLTVLKGTQNLPSDADEPIQQIDQLIKRQLKRAVAGHAMSWDAQLQIEPILQKLVNAMHKVYADKHLKIDWQILPPEQYFLGDVTDLMEMLGNVLDNACKAAKKRVLCQVEALGRWLIISVDDDGVGIPAEKRLSLLNRGVRLDSYTEGQGIGLAVVADLVSAYQGKLEIEQSELGGARIIMQFPLS
jgi:two-component system, OmpR family, sensor histidine kinase PhoQ